MLLRCYSKFPSFWSLGQFRSVKTASRPAKVFSSLQYPVETNVSVPLPALKKTMLPSRASFRAFTPDVSIDSYEVFGSHDRCLFVQDLIRKTFMSHCKPIGRLFEPPSFAFLSERVYHIKTMSIPGSFDFGLCVSRSGSFEAKLTWGIFERTEEVPRIIGTADVGWVRNGEVIEVPETVQRAFLVLQGAKGGRANKSSRSFRYTL